MPYLARVLQVLDSRGVPAEEVCAGTGITPAMVEDPKARVTFDTVAAILERGAAATNDPGLGLELGLETKPTSHSWYGYALISACTVREACEIGIRYLSVRLAPWRVTLFTEGDTAVMQFEENFDLGSARLLVLEYFLGGVIRMGEFLHGHSFANTDIEFWADYPPPPHHARFAGQIPRVRYDCPKLQARHPVAWLDRPLAFAEPNAKREAVSALDQELQLAAPDDWVGRTRALLADPSNEYPDLDAAALALGVSSRSLRRHLQAKGTTYRELREEARRAAAITLLEQSGASIAAVARALRYADVAAFSRAFQRWTGEPPNSYRRQRRTP
jgi:AraC-like DNA-binding protein